jgi:hypothetical protein
VVGQCVVRLVNINDICRRFLEVLQINFLRPPRFPLHYLAFLFFGIGS